MRGFLLLVCCLGSLAWICGCGSDLARPPAGLAVTLDGAARKGSIGFQPVEADNPSARSSHSAYTIPRGKASARQVPRGDQCDQAGHGQAELARKCRATRWKASLQRNSFRLTGIRRASTLSRYRVGPGGVCA